MADVRAFESRDPWTELSTQLSEILKSLANTRETVATISAQVAPHGAFDLRFDSLSGQIDDARGAIDEAKRGIKDQLDSVRGSMEEAKKSIKENMDREVGAMRRALNEQGERIVQLQRQQGLDAAKIEVLRERMERVRWWVMGGVAVLTGLWWVVKEVIMPLKGIH